MLEKEARKRAKGKIVLDVGCGSGIQAIAALSSVARGVLAVVASEKCFMVELEGWEIRKG